MWIHNLSKKSYIVSKTIIPVICKCMFCTLIFMTICTCAETSLQQCTCTYNVWLQIYLLLKIVTLQILLSEFHGPATNHCRYIFSPISLRESGRYIWMRTPARGCRRYPWAVFQINIAQFEPETDQLYGLSHSFPEFQFT